MSASHLAASSAIIRHANVQTQPKMNVADAKRVCHQMLRIPKRSDLNASSIFEIEAVFLHRSVWFLYEVQLFGFQPRTLLLLTDPDCLGAMQTKFEQLIFELTQAG